MCRRVGVAKAVANQTGIARRLLEGINVLWKLKFRAWPVELVLQPSQTIPLVCLGVITEHFISRCFMLILL